MKKLYLGKATLAAIGLAALALAAPASAQTVMRVNIPFAFVAGAESLPAGAYNFVLDANFSLCHIDSFNDGSMHAVHFVPGAARKQDSHTDGGVVQFQKYGDRYFLSGLWKPGNQDGFAVIPSRRLIESAKAQGLGETVSLDSAIR